MHLKEQKENCKKNSQKLDGEAVLSSWKSFTDLQKAKYKEMSLQDKERMKVQFGSTLETKKEKTSFDFEKL